MVRRSSKKAATKAEFVRAQPRDMSAKAIVSKAAAAGMKLGERYVYRVRTLEKGRQRKRPKASKATFRSTVTRAAAPREHLEHVKALRRVILHVGLDRAKEMMDQIVKDLTL